MSKITTLDAADLTLEQLLFMKGQRPGTPCKCRPIYVKKVLENAKKPFSDDPVLLSLEPPLTIIGSLFGHFYDLLCIFESFGYPPHRKYLFLGNILGPGPQSFETLMIILCFKLKYPNSIYVIRGKNEVEFNNSKFFLNQIKKQFDNEEIFYLCNSVFECFPLAAIIGSQIFCVSSGLSHDITHIESISSVVRPFSIDPGNPYHPFLSSKPNASIEKWNDVSIDQWNSGILQSNTQFGLKFVQEFLTTNRLNMILASNTILLDGFEFPFDGDTKFLTFFSVPFYVDKYEKVGTIIDIDETLKIEFRPLRPLLYIYRNYYHWLNPTIKTLIQEQIQKQKLK